MIESVTGYLLETVRGLDPVGPARGNAIALAQILLVFAPHALPKTAPAQGKRTTNPAFRKRRFSMRICSTSALPAHERFPFWADVVASTFVKLDCEAPQRDHFFGSVRHCTIGHSEIVDVASDAQSATRSRQGIALDSSDSLIVNLQILGDCLIETPQLATVIGVGQAAIVETAEKYRLMFPQRFRQIVLKLPRLSWEPNRFSRTVRCCGRRRRGSWSKCPVGRYMKPTQLAKGKDRPFKSRSQRFAVWATDRGIFGGAQHSGQGALPAGDRLDRYSLGQINSYLRPAGARTRRLGPQPGAPVQVARLDR